MTETTHTILIVDDEPEILDSLRRVLRAEPYRILTTESSDQALQIMREQNVDVLLSDIDMPGMNGIELVAHVRQEFPAIVRMLLTGDASLGSALDAINRGEVYRYLTKPWSKEELRQTLKEAVQRLHELRLMVEATKQAARHKLLSEELERAHPGIGTVTYTDGVYVLDREHIEQLMAVLPDSITRAALATPGTPIENETDSASRAKTRPSRRP